MRNKRFINIFVPFMLIDIILASQSTVAFAGSPLAFVSQWEADTEEFMIASCPTGFLPFHIGTERYAWGAKKVSFIDFGNYNSIFLGNQEFLALSGYYKSAEIFNMSYVELANDEIPANAFFNPVSRTGHGLKEIYIDLPQNKDIKKIGDWAFHKCYNLEKFTTGLKEDYVDGWLPQDFVIEFGTGAFSECTSLENISLVGTQIIGNNAFYNCTSLIGREGFGVYSDSVKTIGSYAFYNCDSLEKVRFKEATSLGSCAFEECDLLSSVDLTKAQTIGKYAFKNCDALKEINLPEATYIGWGAFEYSDNLKKVNFPKATQITNYAFFECKKLDEVILPVATRIEEYAFKECDALKNITLPEATYIGWGAFEYSDDLETVNFPKATHIKDYAFYNCQKLNNVSLPMVDRIDWNAFLNCTNLTQISLPNATFIGIDAFKDCTSLKSVYLPRKVTLDRGAFYNCEKLDTLILGGTVPNVLHDNIFDNCPTNRTLYIPAYAVSDYDPDNDGKWRGWTIETLSNAYFMYSFAFDGFWQPIYGTFGGTFGNEISVTVPYGTDITSLTPSITISGGATLSPASGVVNDFTNERVRYTVTAQNPVFKKYYYVTVTVAKNSENDIKTFDFNDLSPSVSGIIDEQKREIELVLPHGTTQMRYAPTITYSEGASISPASGVEQDFSTPVTYIVTAEDGTTKEYDAFITVENKLPKLKSDVIADNTVNIKLNETYSVDLSPLFEDDDNDPLTYRVSIKHAPYTNIDSNYTYIPSNTIPTLLRFVAYDGYGNSINTYNVEITASEVPVTDISFHQTLVMVNKDIVANLVDVLPYTLTPSDATNQGVTWHSSNPHVLSVDNGTGMLEAKLVGSTVVTITSKDTTNGTITDICFVHVIDNSSPPSGIHRGDIVGTLVDSDGNPLAGHNIALYSNPKTTTTDSSGRFVFSNVPYFGHILVINTLIGNEVGRFALNFKKGSTASTNIDNNLNVADITYTENTLSVEVEVQTSIDMDDINAKAKVIDKVPNPKTGE